MKKFCDAGPVACEPGRDSLRLFKSSPSLNSKSLWISLLKYAARSVGKKVVVEVIMFCKGVDIVAGYCGASLNSSVFD